MPDGVICGSLRRFQDLRMAMEWPRIHGGRRRMNSENQLTQEKPLRARFSPPPQAAEGDREAVEGATAHMFQSHAGTRCCWSAMRMA
jgi:hypothetical protein